MCVYDEIQRRELPGVTFGSDVLLRGADRITAGSNVFVDHRVYIHAGTVNKRRGYVILGNDVEVGPYGVLWGGGGITIGNNVHLGAHVHVTSQEGTHDPLSSEDEATVHVRCAPVSIGNDVLIYSGAIITPGVTIGDRAIVAAGAVVVDDVPPDALVAGVPARVVRERSGARGEIGGPSESAISSKRV
jgi:acetyltransferase-like isoleucine patch superfamily enzyme